MPVDRRRRDAMILDFIRDLGAWAWWVGGAVLLALEIVAPGNIFVWFGIAAILTGAVALVADISWQVQLILFAAASLILVIVGRRWFGRAGVERGAAPQRARHPARRPELRARRPDRRRHRPRQDRRYDVAADRAGPAVRDQGAGSSATTARCCRRRRRRGRAAGPTPRRGGGNRACGRCRSAAAPRPRRGR